MTTLKYSHSNITDTFDDLGAKEASSTSFILCGDTNNSLSCKLINTGTSVTEDISDTILSHITRIISLSNPGCPLKVFVAVYFSQQDYISIY